MRWLLFFLLAVVAAGVVVAGVLWLVLRRSAPRPGGEQVLERSEALPSSPLTSTPDPTAPHTALPPAPVPPVPVPSAPVPPAPIPFVAPSPDAATMSESALVTVDLPSPEEMRDRWAATAAVFAGVGHGSSDVNADGGDWSYHDGGGNWARMRRFADGRALLAGHDHEYSETYYADAATYFDEPETDLLAGAPPWWEVAVTQHSRDDGEWIGWIYGWDGRTWRRANYETPDGFAALALPPVSEASTIAMIRQHAYGDEGPPDEDIRAALDLIAAGPDASPTEVTAVGPNITAPAAGVDVARGFAAPGRH